MIISYRNKNKSAKQITNELNRLKDAVLQFLRDPKALYVTKIMEVEDQRNSIIDRDQC